MRLRDFNRFDRAFQSGVAADLGAGRFPRNPFRAEHLVAVDFHAIDGDSPQHLTRMTHDLALGGIPFPDATLDFIYAFDFLEHIARQVVLPGGQTRFPFIELFQEIHRTLRPGGLLLAVTPAVPRLGAFVDPTHVNFVTRGTLDYFAGPCHARALGYGYTGALKVLWNDWIPSSHALWSSHDTARNREDLGQSPFIVSALGLLGAEKDRLLAKFSARKSQHLLWVVQRP